MAESVNTSSLESGASSALGSSANAAASTNPMVAQLLEHILKSGTLGGQPLTTTGPQPSQPSAPPQFQAPDATYSQGDFNSSGERKRADSAALMHSIAGITKAAANHLHEKKVRQMSMDVDRAMSAIQGINEAKASGDQTALQKNQEILNEMFSDPKKVKAFEKAFNIPLVGDHKNKATPEYQGLIKAIRGKKSEEVKQAGAAMAAKFQSAMPQRSQINPALQAQAELTKAGLLPSVKETIEGLKTVQQSIDKGSDRDAKVKMAEMLVKAKDKQSIALIMKQAMANYGKQGVAETLGRFSVRRSQIMAGAMQQDTQWRMAGEILSARIKANPDSKQISDLSKEHQRLTDAIKDDNKQLDGLSFIDKKIDTVKDWIGISTKASKIKGHLNELRGQQQRIIKRMDQLNLGSKDDGNSNTAGGSSSTEDGRFDDFDKFFESTESGLLSDSDSEDKE